MENSSGFLRKAGEYSFSSTEIKKSESEIDPQKPPERPMERSDTPLLPVTPTIDHGVGQIKSEKKRENRTRCWNWIIFYILAVAQISVCIFAIIIALKTDWYHLLGLDKIFGEVRDANDNMEAIMPMLRNMTEQMTELRLLGAKIYARCQEHSGLGEGEFEYFGDHI
jgi:hypothetical protein